MSAHAAGCSLEYRVHCEVFRSAKMVQHLAKLALRVRHRILIEAFLPDYQCSLLVIDRWWRRQRPNLIVEQPQSHHGPYSETLF